MNEYSPMRSEIQEGHHTQHLAALTPFDAVEWRLYKVGVIHWSQTSWVPISSPTFQFTLDLWSGHCAVGRAATSHQQTAYLATSHWSHTPHTPSLLLPVRVPQYWHWNLVICPSLFWKLLHFWDLSLPAHQNVAITYYKLPTVEKGRGKYSKWPVLCAKQLSTKGGLW